MTAKKLTTLSIIKYRRLLSLTIRFHHILLYNLIKCNFKNKKFADIIRLPNGE